MPILARELEGLVAAGATYIQIDEPSPAIHPEAPPTSRRCSTPPSRRSSGGSGSAPTCASATTWVGRWRGGRTGRCWSDARASRSMSWSSSWPTARWPSSRCSARSPPPAGTSRAGVIDVKNYHLESADEVAERIEAVLAAGVPAERLTAGARLRLQPDGPLGDARQARALVAGRDLVLGRPPRHRVRRRHRWTATGSRCSAPGSSATSTR